MYKANYKIIASWLSCDVFIIVHFLQLKLYNVLGQLLCSSFQFELTLRLVKVKKHGIKNSSVLNNLEQMQELHKFYCPTVCI